MAPEMTCCLIDPRDDTAREVYGYGPTAEAAEANARATLARLVAETIEFDEYQREQMAEHGDTIESLCAEWQVIEIE